mmetsp:Transcript_5772/g.10897  ORF Transcript_5772/g.10897 Transcript_5772/m.10897 type:complete len:229 (-) Transcript_5772:1076-1762(-)
MSVYIPCAQKWDIHGLQQNATHVTSFGVNSQYTSQCFYCFLYTQRCTPDQFITNPEDQSLTELPNRKSPSELLAPIMYTPSIHLIQSCNQHHIADWCGDQWKVIMKATCHPSAARLTPRHTRLVAKQTACRSTLYRSPRDRWSECSTRPLRGTLWTEPRHPTHQGHPPVPHCTRTWFPCQTEPRDPHPPPQLCDGRARANSSSAIRCTSMLESPPPARGRRNVCSAAA